MSLPKKTNSQKFLLQERKCGKFPWFIRTVVFLPIVRYKIRYSVLHAFFYKIYFRNIIFMHNYFSKEKMPRFFFCETAFVVNDRILLRFVLQCFIFVKYIMICYFS